MLNQLIDFFGSLELTKEGVAAHLWRLVQGTDEYLRVGGMCVLLETGTLQRTQADKILELSRYPAVRTRAFDFFIAKQEIELATQLLNLEDGSSPPQPTVRMKALLNEDWQTIIDVEGRSFLHDGLWDRLIKISDYAEQSVGWRESTVWAMRALLLHPYAPSPIARLLTLLDEANQFEEIQRLVAILEKLAIHHEMQCVFGARICLNARDFDKLSQIIAKIPMVSLEPNLKAKVYNTLASACEAQGRFREAFDWFEKQHNLRRPSRASGNHFCQRVEHLAATDVDDLSRDERTDHYMMVGFPRSGTTLLENALAAHPNVETFEEISACRKLFRAIEQIAVGQSARSDKRRVEFEMARDCYYSDIASRIKKLEASVYIDKMPIRSAHIGILEKMFPNKKYIFSIRHPCDVVLSCFRQQFRQNDAMENFRRFADACSLYDFVMSKWFSVFPIATERVHYVKYDDLIQNFEDELRKVLGFVGVEWNEAVLDFGSLSERRKVSTPSYAKVRAGLKLGVQSNWRNYAFLFEKAEAKPLQRWIDHFGY
jgi:hypothetical protein